MIRWTAILVTAFAALAPVAEQAIASDPPAAADLEGDAEARNRAQGPPPIIRREARSLDVVRPALGSGYVPYRYPAFDTCPCGDAGCYHPGWYYCGGKSYRRAWWQRWAGAHLGHGSMLERHPCHCVHPTFGRPDHVPAVEAATVESEARRAESQPAAAAP